jgi:hypothetical protein
MHLVGSTCFTLTKQKWNTYSPEDGPPGEHAFSVRDPRVHSLGDYEQKNQKTERNAVP